MKHAAVLALAQLAREPVPAAVSRAYNDRQFQFGPEYIIPTPFDPRVLMWVAPAVAKAAMESGVARRPIEDWSAYTVALERHMDPGRGLLQEVIREARRDPKRIVLAEGNDPRVIKAASVLAGEGIAQPILLGSRDEIEATAEGIGVDLDGVDVVLPRQSPQFEQYVASYLEVNQRRGVTPATARGDMARRTDFGMMMVQSGDVDGIVVGATRPYAEAIRPALRVIGSEGRACGLTTVLTREETLFFADTTVNIDPNAETLAEIAALVVGHVRSYGIEPRVAMLSFANFGGVRHDDTQKMAKAAELVRQRIPGLMVEGEVQVDIAWDMTMRTRFFPWSRLTKRANTFIFPNLASANITYKMLHQVANLSVFGPILLGMRRPVGVLPLDTDASNIVNVAASTVVDAQRRDDGV
jgi:malate dehydrogenase (oxaloacetate-decarboxylating)(NADP+)